MSQTFCWMCGINYTFTPFEGPKHLDEDGKPPCIECLQELNAFDPDEEDCS